jgi:hypothetical protein
MSQKKLSGISESPPRKLSQMNLELDMPDKSPKPELKKKNQQEFKQFLNVQKQESARNL